jgi:protein O-GlcNAc transferase
MSDVLFQDAVRRHQAGQLAEAERLYGAVLRAVPRHFEANYFLGFVHMQRGEFAEAERMMGEALRINPRSPDAHYNRGCVLQQMQRNAEAIAAFDAALVIKPDFAEAAINRGTALLAEGQYEAALASFDAGLALSPRDTHALASRGTALFELKRYGEAASNYERLLALDPDFPYARGSLALTRAYCCDWHSRNEDLSRLHCDIRAGKPALVPHAATLLLDDAEDQLLSARCWAMERPVPPPLWRGERYRHEKIRIAYVSADFHSHATAFLAAGLFEHHDRSRFETVAISLGPDDGSPMRARLSKAFDRFADLRGRSDAEAARAMRNAEIDIAVDLKGYTQNARPGIFAARAAPVQVNYLGHPGTMGAPYMDYILADSVIVPDEHRRFYSEQVAFLPGSYQCNDNTRRISERPVNRAAAELPDKGPVFVSFNNLYKITPEVFGVWMRLLHSREGSILWLLDDNALAKANLKREAAARGVAAERLIFAPRVIPEEHLARQRLGDLFLDTLPCNAHTTASDALWAGLPVLTCMGMAFAGRVAASLLHAAGLPELVASSLQEYEAIAMRLAGSTHELAAVKDKLARNRDTCPLFDTEKTTRNIEAAFAIMHERSMRGLPPASFSLA